MLEGLQKKLTDDEQMHAASNTRAVKNHDTLGLMLSCINHSWYSSNDTKHYRILQEPGFSK